MRKEGKEGGEIKRDVHKETKKVGERGGGGNTVAAAVVFHWKELVYSSRLEPLRGHMIIRPRYSEVYGSSLLPGLWKERDFASCQVFPNMLQKLKHESHGRPNVFSTFNVTQASFLFRLSPKSEKLLLCLPPFPLFN